MLLPIEGRAWQLTLAELGGTRAPCTWEGVLEAAKQLPDPTMHSVLQRCKPLTPGEPMLAVWEGKWILDPWKPGDAAALPPRLACLQEGQPKSLAHLFSLPPCLPHAQ